MPVFEIGTDQGSGDAFSTTVVNESEVVEKEHDWDTTVVNASSEESECAGSSFDTVVVGEEEKESTEMSETKSFPWSGSFVGSKNSVTETTKKEAKETTEAKVYPWSGSFASTKDSDVRKSSNNLKEVCDSPRNSVKETEEKTARDHNSIINSQETTATKSAPNSPATNKKANDDKDVQFASDKRVSLGSSSSAWVGSVSSRRSFFENDESKRTNSRKDERNTLAPLPGQVPSFIQCRMWCVCVLCGLFILC